MTNLMMCGFKVIVRSWPIVLDGIILKVEASDLIGHFPGPIKHPTFVERWHARVIITSATSPENVW